MNLWLRYYFIVYIFDTKNDTVIHYTAEGKFIQKFNLSFKQNNKSKLLKIISPINSATKQAYTVVQKDANSYNLTKIDLRTAKYLSEIPFTDYEPDNNPKIRIDDKYLYFISVKEQTRTLNKIIITK